MPWMMLFATTFGLLSPEDLRPRLELTQIVDARSEEALQHGRLPGSVSLPWEEWTLEKAGLWNRWFGEPARWGKTVDDPSRVQARLRAVGLSHAKPIVVVGTPHGWGEEGRVAWNLLFWGAENVALLDGGFPAWKAAFPELVETGKLSPRPTGDFTVRLAQDRRATLEEVRGALGGPSTLLDARTTEEFAGERISGQKRGGRLPGATLVPAASLYRPDGKYVTAEELKRLFPGSPRSPIAYCVGGVRSALLALLFEARLGVKVANYDGSMWEWSRHPELPLER